MRDVFPGKENIYAKYRLLPRRELAIVAASVMDATLAELLFEHLSGPESEIHSFLGADGDGRARFIGARIQLGLLPGIVTPDDVAAAS